MDFMELMKERFSARAFEDKPVSQEMQEQILAAGLAAPTARNSLMWRERTVRKSL